MGADSSVCSWLMVESLFVSQLRSDRIFDKYVPDTVSLKLNNTVLNTVLELEESKWH
jgi:hypothetical protein